jgi:hypothetical protein
MAESHPRISFEGIASIWLALIGVGGAGALFVLPHPYADYVGWTLIGVAFIGAASLTIYHLHTRGWLKWFSLSRSAVAVAAIACAAVMLVADYWYYSNYSTNGGVWHLQIGITPLAPQLPQQQPAPIQRTVKPEAPWVSQQEIEEQQKLNRLLLNYSPGELLRMWQEGRDVNIYLGKWIKIDYEFGSLKIDTLDKKQYLMVRMVISGVYYLSAYFDQKKWESKLLYLRPKEGVRAYCLFKTIDNFEYTKGFTVGNLIAIDCETF